MAQKLMETDLYEPIRRHLEKAGYTVKAEVNDCDLVAARQQQLLAVELKLSLNLAVISQAVQRQRLLPEVWIAVPKPGRQLKRSRWQELLHLLQRLELGLFLVSLDLPGQPVETILLPRMLDRSQIIRSNKKRFNQLKEEFWGRIGDHNIGGSQKARMTVYKQQALLAAALLGKEATASAARLRQLGAGPKTWQILYDNHYGWFSSPGRGSYTLTPAGHTALAEHALLVRQLVELATGGQYETIPGHHSRNCPKLEEKSMKEGG